MLTRSFSDSGGTWRSRTFGSFSTWRRAVGVVLAHGVAHEGVVGEEADQVRVPLEDDSVEVPGLALEPVRALEDADEGVELRIRLRDVHLQPDVVLPGEGVEVEDDSEALGLVRLVEVVDRAEVQEELEVALRVVAEQRRRLDPGSAGNSQGEITTKLVGSEEIRPQRFGQNARGGTRNERWGRSAMALTMVRVFVRVGLGDDAKREHAPGGQALRAAGRVVLSPRPPPLPPIDCSRAGSAHAVRALRSLGLLAVADPLLDLHDRGEERFRRGRAARARRRRRG